MKKFTIIILFCLASLQFINAQVPQGMNYQAIARDLSGAILPNQNVSLRISITNGNGGSVVYKETQSTTTNMFGLFTLNIGNGTPLLGLFPSIDWPGITAWMQIEMDPTGGVNFSNMGSSQLLSVPYALHSADGNPKIGFNASVSSGADFGSTISVTYIFGNENYDDGNNYDPATGTFTAPHAGVYNFAASLAFSPNGTPTSYVRMGFYVNGSYSNQGTATVITPSTVGTWNISTSGLLKLNQGDQVTVNVYNGNSVVYSYNSYGGASYFTGVQLY